MLYYSILLYNVQSCPNLTQYKIDLPISKPISPLKHKKCSPNTTLYPLSNAQCDTPTFQHSRAELPIPNRIGCHHLVAGFCFLAVSRLSCVLFAWDTAAERVPSLYRCATKEVRNGWGAGKTLCEGGRVGVMWSVDDWRGVNVEGGSWSYMVVQDTLFWTTYLWYGPYKQWVHRIEVRLESLLKIRRSG